MPPMMAISMGPVECQQVARLHILASSRRKDCKLTIEGRRKSCHLVQPIERYVANKERSGVLQDSSLNTARQHPTAQKDCGTSYGATSAPRGFIRLAPTLGILKRPSNCLRTVHLSIQLMIFSPRWNRSDKTIHFVRLAEIVRAGPRSRLDLRIG